MLSMQRRVPLLAESARSRQLWRLLASKRIYRSAHASLSSVEAEDIPFSNARLRMMSLKKVDIATNTGRLVILQPPTEGSIIDGPVDIEDHRESARYAKNRVHVTSLLDACISSKDLGRAELIVKRSKNVLSSDEYLRGYNSFLKAVTEEVLYSNHDFKKALELFDYILNDYQGPRPDDRTFAIMISASVRLKDKVQSEKIVMRLVSVWEANTGRNLGDILRHSDLFPALVLARTISLCGINEKTLSPEYHYILESLKTPSNQDNFEEQEVVDNSMSLSDKLLLMSKRNATDIIEKLPPDIEKAGVTSLDPVKSYGLKNLRAALQGIASGERPPVPVYDDGSGVRTDWQKFTDMDEQLSRLSPSDQESYRDAFEQYNTDRQRALERLALHSAKSRWQHDFMEMQARGDVNIKRINPLLWEWHTSLVALITEELEKVKTILTKLDPAESFDTAPSRSSIKKIGMQDEMGMLTIIYSPTYK